MKKLFFILNLVALLAISPGTWAQSGDWLDDANLPSDKKFSKMDADKSTYYIGSESELALLAYWEKNQQIKPNMVFVLEKDLDMSAHYWTPRGFSGKKDQESGTITHVTLDGNGHTISGIHNPTTYNSYGGLFRLVNYAVIKNLKIANSTMSGNETAGAITSITSFSVRIENCSLGADVTISSPYTAGGFVGNSGECTLVGCVSAASINGNIEAGGLMGFAKYSTIKDCLYVGTSLAGTGSRGAMIGSIGSEDSPTNTIENSYYTYDRLEGKNSDDVLAYSVENRSREMTVNYGTPTTQYDVSGIGAFHHGVTYDGKRYIEDNGIVEFTASPLDEKKLIVNLWANSELIHPETGNRYRVTINGKNCVLSCDIVEITWEGEGTGTAPYLIKDHDEMNLLATIVNGGTDFAGTYFCLANDLDFSGVSFVPVGLSGKFNGTFDGQGKTISGINIDDDVAGGVFGQMGGTVKNLRLANSTIIGGKDTGGIVSTNYGTVKNCKVADDVTVKAADYFRNFGGIVGHNNGGTIEACASAASVINSENSVEGYGGIVGNNEWGTVKNCIYYGKEVSAGTSTYVGAIAGYDTNGSYSNNIYYTSNADMKAIGDEEAYDNDGAKRAYTVSSGTEGLTLSFGDAYFTYEYDGIALYGYGTMLDGTFYTTEGKTVEFTGSTSEGNVVRDMAASAGTFTDGDPCSLTMPAMDVVITANVSEDIVLYDNADNTATLEQYNGIRVNATLQGRTLQKNGYWAPLCLPFNVKSFEGTPLEGADVQMLERSGFYDGTLYLTFTPVTAIEAGVPYLVRWKETGDPVVNPEFRGMVVNDKLTPTGTSAVQFRGFFSPVQLQKNDKKVLYMGGKSTLYYPTADITLNAMRCYFYLYNVVAGKPGSASNAADIRLVFEDGETTDITLTEIPTAATADSNDIYNLSGQRMESPAPNGQPSAVNGAALPRGIYIMGGKKVVVK